MMVLVYMVVQNILSVKTVKLILTIVGILNLVLNHRWDIDIIYLGGLLLLGIARKSNEYNDETVWVEKKGEARLDTHTYHVGNSPITVRGGINAGYWKEGSVKGSHKEYYAEVSHDPIKLGKMQIYAS